jgi:hypothetical protein
MGTAMILVGLYGALGRSAPRVSMRWQRTMNRIFTLGKLESDPWEGDPNSAGLVRFTGWGLVVIGILVIVIGLTQSG